MAKVMPFSAVHYNQNIFSNTNDLLSSPSLEINTDQYKLLKKNINNFSNLIYVDDENTVKNKFIANVFLGWLLRDILIVDKKPSYYILEEEVFINGNKRKRLSIIGLIKIDDDSQSIKPLEKPVDLNVEEYYTFLKEVRNNFEPALCFYKDEKFTLINRITQFLSNDFLLLDLPNQKGNYKLYRIEDNNMIKEIASYFVDKRIYVADSDYYYAGLKFSNEMKAQPVKKLTGKEPYNFMMANLFNIYDENLAFQPLNRLIRKEKTDYINMLKQMESAYKIGAITFSDSKMEMMARKKIRMVLNENGANNIISFGIFVKSIPNRYFIINLKESMGKGDIGAEILDSGIINKYLNIQEDQYYKYIFYDKNDDRTFYSIKSGKYDMAFILPTFDKKILVERLDGITVFPSKSIGISPSILRGSTIFSFKYSTIFTI